MTHGIRNYSRVALVLTLSVLLAFANALVAPFTQPAQAAAAETIPVSLQNVDTSGKDTGDPTPGSFDPTPESSTETGVVNGKTAPAQQDKVFIGAVFKLNGKELPLESLTADLDGETYTLHINAATNNGVDLSWKGNAAAVQKALVFRYQAPTSDDYTVKYSITGGDGKVKLLGNRMIENSSTSYTQFVSKTAGGTFQLRAPRGGVLKVLGSDYVAKSTTDPGFKQEYVTAGSNVYDSPSVRLTLLRDTSTETETIQLWEVRPKQAATVNISYQSGNTFRTTWRWGIGQAEWADWGSKHTDGIRSKFNYHRTSTEFTYGQDPDNSSLDAIPYGSDLDLYFNLFSPNFFNCNCENYNNVQYDYLTYIRINGEPYLMPNTPMPITKSADVNAFKSGYLQMRKNILAKFGSGYTVTPTSGPNAGSTITIKPVDARVSADTAAFAKVGDQASFDNFNISLTDHFLQRANSWRFRFEVKIEKARPYVQDIFANDAPAIGLDISIEHSTVMLLKNVGSSGIETDGYLDRDGTGVNYTAGGPLINGFALYQNQTTSHSSWVLYNTVGNPWGAIDNQNADWSEGSYGTVFNDANGNYAKMRFKVRNGYVNPVAKTQSDNSGATLDVNLKTATSGDYVTVDRLPLVTFPAQNTVALSDGRTMKVGRTQVVQVVATPADFGVVVEDGQGGSTALTDINVEKNRLIQIPTKYPKIPAGQYFAGYQLINQKPDGTEVAINSTKYIPGESIDVTTLSQRLTSTTGERLVGKYILRPTFDANPTLPLEYQVVRKLYKASKPTALEETQLQQTFTALPGMTAKFIDTPEASVTGADGNTYKYDSSGSTLLEDQLETPSATSARGAVTAPTSSDAPLVLRYEWQDYEKPTALAVDEKLTVADPTNLTPEERDAVKQNVFDGTPGLKDLVDRGIATVEVDAQGNVTVTYPDGSKQTLKAPDTVQKKAPVLEPLIEVANPTSLTQAEKDAVADAIRAKEKLPDDVTVTVNDDGTAKITYSSGVTVDVPRDNLVRQDSLAAPSDAVVVVPDTNGNVTEADQQRLVDAVKAANPNLPANATVVADNTGKVTVTFADGTKEVLEPAKVLWKAPKLTLARDVAKPTAAEKGAVESAISKANEGVHNAADTTFTWVGNEVGAVENSRGEFTQEQLFAPYPALTPAADPNSPTDAEKQAAQAALNTAYPTAQSIVVKDNGSAVVTMANGQVLELSAADVFKPSTVKRPARVLVQDATNLTEAEKQKVAEAVFAKNPQLAALGYTADDIEVSADGTAKVIAPSGEVVATLPNLAGSYPAYTTVADPAHLTQAEKDLVKERVLKANPQWTDVTVNDDGSVTAKNASGESETLTPQETIAVSPQLTKVADVNNLTADDKLAVAQAIIKAQVDAGLITDSGACVAGDPITCGDFSVTVTDSGLAVLTYPADESGNTHKAEFTQLQTVQPQKLNSPDAAFAVADPAHLTDAEKAQLADAVRQANNIPASIPLTVSDDGKVTATYPKGEELTVAPTLVTLPNLTVVDKLPTAEEPLSEDEVRAITAAIIAKNDGLTNGNISVDPATGTVTVTKGGKTVTLAPNQVITKQPELTPVADMAAPIPEDKHDAIKAKVAETLPAGSKFKWGKDADGNDQLTATLPNGQTVTYPKEQLVKPASVSAPEKLTPVVDPAHLTDAEKALVEHAVRDANKLPSNATVKVADDGTVTVTYADGSTDTITPDKTVLKQPALTPVVNGSKLSDAEKQAVEDAIKAANSSLADSKIVVDADGTAHVFDGEKEIATFSPEQTVAPLPALTEVDPATGPQAADLPKIADAILQALPGAGEAIGEPVTNPDGSVTLQLENGGSITVNPDGSANVTLPNGQTVSYNDGQTWKPASLNAPQRTPIADPAHLTDAEKEAVEAAVRAANKLPGSATVTVGDDGKVTVTYVDGSTQALEPLQTVIVLPDITPVRDNTNLTPAEVQKVIDEIIAANPTLTPEQIVVDPATGATVINDAEGNKIAEFTPAQTISPAPSLIPVQDMKNLTPEEQKQVADAVAAQNNLGDPVGEPTQNADGSYTQEYPNGASVTVQPDGTTVVTMPNGKKVKYPAEELVRPAKLALPLLTPVVAKNAVTGDCPETGCTDERADVVAAIREANPDLPKNAEITVDESGNVVVTYADGSFERISGVDTVVQIPQLTPVTNPEKLTQAEKDRVAAAVRQSNSQLPADAVLKVADDGTVTIESADGKVLGIIPGSETVVQIPNLTPVADLSSPTADNLQSIAAAIGDAAKLGDSTGEPEVAEDGTVTQKFANGTVTVAPDGSATLVFNNGMVAKFSPIETMKPATVNSPLQLLPVADPNHLTDAEKAAALDAVRAANPNLPANATLTIADDGTVTITYADGSTAVIARDDVVRVNSINKPLTPIVVGDPNHLTAAEKAAIADAIRKANPNIPADAVITVSDNGTVTVTFRDGSQLILKPAMVGEEGGWLATTGDAAQGTLLMLISLLLGAGGLLLVGGARRRQERNGRHYA